MGLSMRSIPLLLCCCLIGACDHGKTRACFGSTEFCQDAFGRNRPPEARVLAADQVSAGESVELDGTPSFDPDGRITSFSWTQEAGPTVALTGSSNPVAQFLAPDVTAETSLNFRLVVTDDDDASDTERLRILVRPSVTSALTAGVELLKTLDRPQAPATGAECPRCWSSMGLWLAARARAAAAGAEPAVDQLLDELRVIELLEADRVPAESLPEPHLRLFQLGQRAVASFTETRDPATAELARDLTGITGPADAGEWRRAIAAVYPELRRTGTLSRPELTRKLLLAQPHATSPEAAAAAIVALTAAEP